MPSLNWIGKDAVVKHHKDVPFRLLEQVPELWCGDTGSGNLIVQGDNLHALKALPPRYAGQVKCIYIDPPYNTGNEGWAYSTSKLCSNKRLTRWRCKLRLIDFERAPMQTAEIVAEACKLGWSSRLELVQTILKTMQPQEAQAELLWREEVLRRVAAHRSGLEPGIPAEEVLGHL